MPSLYLYIPLSRQHGLLLRLVESLVRRLGGECPVQFRHAELPDHLRKDVGLPPEVERPPPLRHRFPF
ncbi:hypothetical protein SAMN05444358_109120 [Ruegeria halocynthiae]|uniref:Uncharacterized protein n=1 Tax=Ruegeria halocynthiae TaxID=985054 RepID=A0A1H3DWC9_9RHOB|nr:hypothetical protein SAMN05444358_109120 [Ruegeria halocynthiae]